MRRLVFTALLALAGVWLWRRWRADRRERVDLYFEDGSMVSFEGGSEEGDRLLALAGDILAGARA